MDDDDDDDDDGGGGGDKYELGYLKNGSKTQSTRNEGEIQDSRQHSQSQLTSSV
jgi:hypothetical protein